MDEWEITEKSNEDIHTLQVKVQKQERQIEKLEELVAQLIFQVSVLSGGTWKANE